MGQAFLDFGLMQPSFIAQQAAIAAAQAGDWGPANAMELAFLNDPVNGIQPDTGDEVGELIAYRIERHDDGLHVLWIASIGNDSILERCPHLGIDAKPVPQDHYPDCLGTGYRGDVEGRKPLGLRYEVTFIETDIDGRILSIDGEAVGEAD